MQMKKYLSLTVVFGALALAPLFGTGEVGWIPIETTPSSFSAFADSSSVPLETRVCDRAGGTGVPVEARVKSCGRSDRVFLNTEKIIGLLMILN